MLKTSKINSKANSKTADKIKQVTTNPSSSGKNRIKESVEVGVFHSPNTSEKSEVSDTSKTVPNYYCVENKASEVCLDGTKFVNIDLRSLEFLFRSVSTVSRLDLCNCVCSSINFNSITRISESRFVENNFADSSFQLIKFDTNTFVNCNFSKADFEGSTFKDVTIENCDFSNSLMHTVSFIDVDFIGVKFANIEFVNTTFKCCNFECIDLTKTNFIKGVVFEDCIFK